MKNLLVIPAAIALTLSLSACGDSKDSAGGNSASPSAGTSAPATPSGGNGGGTITGNGGGSGTDGGNDGGGNGSGKLTPAQSESLTKLRNCMIKKGYDMPEINPNNPVLAPKNTNGKSDEQVNKDAAECATQSQGG